MFKLDDKTAKDLVMEGYDPKDWTPVEEGEDGFVKHDITAYYQVFHYKPEDTYWLISYHSSYSYGIFEYNIHHMQVVPTEEVIKRTIWKPVEER